MNIDGPAGQPETPPHLPNSIWVVAWASLAGQLLLVARQGVRGDDEVFLVVSVILGSLIVGYVSAGVVRARTFRLALAWVVLVLSLIAELVGLVLADDSGLVALDALSLATTASALAGLVMFSRSDWYAWQRTKPASSEGASIGQLIAIGVLVGVLGGLVEPSDHGAEVRISASDR